MTALPTDRGPSEENTGKLIAEIERKHGKTAAQLRLEREKRVADAMALRIPDRVPVNVGTGGFAARYGGLTASAMFYDHAAYRDACRKMLLDFEPDNGAMGAGSSGLALEYLDSRQYRWPGGTLPPDGTYQFVEGEYMRPDEYGHFLSAPGDFVIRRYLPRTYGALVPLEALPPLPRHFDSREVSGMLGLLFRPEFAPLTPILEDLHRPELGPVLKTIERVRQVQHELGRESAAFAAEMERLGFPSGGPPAGPSGATFAPFDTISDRLRGMRGAMLDMYRTPDQLLACCRSLLDWEMSTAVPARTDARGNPARSGMPLHRGSDGFMSRHDFEKFYWPTL